MRNSGGAVVLDQMFGVGKLWTSAVDFHSGRYRETVAVFDQPPGRHHLLRRGDAIGDWSVLAPDADTDYSRADDNALVLSGKINGTKILLLSDLSRTGQARLLDHPEQLPADIVVSGLPADGGGEPLSDALLEAVHPRAIVIVDSEYPAQRRANSALRERLAEKNIPVFYTRGHGAIKIVVDPHGWRLSAVDGTLLKWPGK